MKIIERAFKAGDCNPCVCVIIPQAAKNILEVIFNEKFSWESDGRGDGNEGDISIQFPTDSGSHVYVCGEDSEDLEFDSVEAEDIFHNMIDDIIEEIEELEL